MQWQSNTTKVPTKCKKGIADPLRSEVKEKRKEEEKEEDRENRRRNGKQKLAGKDSDDRPPFVKESL